jgi:hypothetical protein
MSQFAEAVIPDELRLAERDPWFDRLTVLSKVEGLTTLSKVEGLTTLSEAEGESSESDELKHSILWGEQTCSYSVELNK